MTQSAAVQPLIALLALAFVALLLALIFWPQIGLYARWRRAQRLDERVLIEDALKHLYGARLHQRKPTLQSLAGAPTSAPTAPPCWSSASPSWSWPN